MGRRQREKVFSTQIYVESFALQVMFDQSRKDTGFIARKRSPSRLGRAFATQSWIKRPVHGEEVGEEAKLPNINGLLGPASSRANGLGQSIQNGLGLLPAEALVRNALAV